MTIHDFGQWLRAYGNAWITRDPDAVVRLFAAEAAYHEKPFEEPMVGTRAIHRYWTEGAQRGQTDITFEARPISFAQDTGYAHWHATFRRVPSRTFVELEGIFMARFDAAMCCQEFREWWHRREQEREQVMVRYVDPTEQLVLELSVRSLNRSVTFYRVLGFDLLRETERFAILAWEGHQLFLQQTDNMLEPPAAAVVNLRVMVADVDRVWQRMTELGPRVIVPLGDRHYGLRDFTVADPDGYELRFATRLQTAG